MSHRKHLERGAPLPRLTADPTGTQAEGVCGRRAKTTAAFLSFELVGRWSVWGQVALAFASAAASGCSTGAGGGGASSRPVLAAPPPKDDGQPSKGGGGGDAHSAALEQLKMAAVGGRGDRHRGGI